MNEQTTLINGLTQAWRDENASARNYQALAEREPNPDRKAILLRLAEAEVKHAANWQTRLKELGADPGVYQESTGDRTRRWLLVQSGTDNALKRIESTEDAGALLYEQLASIAPTQTDRDSIHFVQREEQVHSGFAHLATEAPGNSVISPQVMLDTILHRESWHKRGGGWIGQAIYGANDGLGSVFGIVSGVSAV